MNNEKELNLESLNEIDMECDFNEEDDSFGGQSNNINLNNNPVEKTGIIVNFNDDDEDIKPMRTTNMRTISADVSDNGIHINNNFNNRPVSELDINNEIDMECDFGEDDDSFGSVNMNENKSTEKVFTFDDEDDDLLFSKKELVDETMIEEKKSPRISTGEVEADYWAKLQKKHSKSNVKGSYNNNFHFAGNPTEEKNLFNHMMDVKTPSTFTDLNLSSNTTTSSTSSGEASSSGGEGCCESLNEDLNNICKVIGFEAIPNSDGSYLAMDVCDDNDDINAVDLQDLLVNLKPYIDDCIIIPLQITTGQKFNDYQDWENWYSLENQQKYPNCSSDINYCKLLNKLINKQ